MKKEINGIWLDQDEIETLRASYEKSNKRYDRIYQNSNDRWSQDGSYIGTEEELREMLKDTGWGYQEFISDEENKYSSQEDAENSLFDEFFQDCEEIDEETIKLFLAE